MAEYKEARTTPAKGKMLDHLQIRKGEDGGHVIEHHFANDGMSYHKPKSFVFGEDEGPDALEHIGKHMGIHVEGPAEEADYVESAGNKGDA